MSDDKKDLGKIKIWLDNTGIHNVGRCLDGRAKSDVDIEGFLQFAILVAFSNRMEFNPFEPEHIAERTDIIINRLGQIGVSKEVLHDSRDNQDSYALACGEAAREAAKDLRYVFLPGGDNVHGLAPELQRGQDVHSGFLDLVDSGVSQAHLQQVLESALADKAAGAVDYMVAVNHDLRCAIREKAISCKDWSDAHTHQLGAFLRFYLNTLLGCQNHGTYAPAVGRARLVRRANLFYLDRLVDLADEITVMLRGAALPLPSLHAALVIEGKGELEAILDVACQKRERTPHIRRWLEASVEGSDEARGDYFVKAEAEMNEIRTAVFETLRRCRHPELEAPVTLQGFHGIPNPSLDPMKLATSFKHWRLRSRFMVVTEMSALAAFDPRADEYLQRFRANCYGSA